MDKTWNNRAWFMVLPVLVLVAFNAIVPLMTVVNYSVQETFGDNVFFFHGVGWFQEVLASERFHAALGRQLAFTAIILLIEIPLGVAIALAMPRRGIWVSVCLVLMALPLLIPWNVVGAIWNIFALPQIGLLGQLLNGLGFSYNYTREPLDAWFTLILMDVWHWTSLVVLLAYAGLISIPDAYYQAARIDGASRWQLLRFVVIPSLYPTIRLSVFFAIVGSLQLFDLVMPLTRGGPADSSHTMVSFLYTFGITRMRVGFGSAVGVILFVICVIFAFSYKRWVMRDE